MKLIKIAALCLAFALAFTTTTVMADGHEDKSEKVMNRPSMSASRTVTMEATVEAIDHETREVTLAGEGGSTTFTASPDVRNLAQVEVGDSVFAEYYEEISISVHANPDGMQPSSGALQAEARAAAGEMPGAGAMDTMIITALVEEINIEANTFKLKYDDGSVEEYTARDPENLKRSEVGDIVVITITQAMGIMVERPSAE